MQDKEQGIEGIFRRHVKSVYRLCYSYMGNAPEAEDATQSVFMKLVDKPRSFESTDHERAWLLRVAANHCKDVLKSAARTRTVSLDSGRGVTGVADSAGGGTAGGVGHGTNGTRSPWVSEPVDPSATVEQSDVLQAVLALPDVYKDCIYLHYYEGYKSDEIAQMTDSNPSTVRNRLADARNMLRTALEA